MCASCFDTKQRHCMLIPIHLKQTLLHVYLTHLPLYLTHLPWWDSWKHIVRWGVEGICSAYLGSDWTQTFLASGAHHTFDVLMPVIWVPAYNRLPSGLCPCYIDVIKHCNNLPALPIPVLSGIKQLLCAYAEKNKNKNRQCQCSKYWPTSSINVGLHETENV